MQLEEAFASAIDAAKWTTSKIGFEATGTGAYTVGVSGGVLNIEGVADGDFWSGASLKSAKGFVATKDLNLIVEVDRVALDQAGTAGRSGVYITTGNRSKYVFFAHNAGENGWQVNVNPGSATGGGNNIAAFDGLDGDVGKHRMKLVADGERVEVFLDGLSGGKFPLEASSGLFVELGGYARAAGDTVKAVFDNVRIENALPCLGATPSTVAITQADASQKVALTIPQLLNDAAAVTVTVTSRNPAVAVPAGAANGVLTLTFAAGAANTQTFAVLPTGLGSTTFEIVSTPAVCTTGSVAVEVVSVPQVLLTDQFTGTSVSTGNWKEDATPFETGTATPESGIKIENGQVKFTVTVESAPWPGLALLTAKTYSAKASEPITFEVDRVLLDFDLVTGTGAEQRTGIWVKDASGNFVLFADHVAHEGRNFGWGYNKQSGAPDDNPTGNSINIAAFDAGAFDDRKQHHLKIVANGSTVKLFLDGVFGATVPFPFAQGLTFGFGAYSDEGGNVVRGTFDNVTLSGGAAPTTGRFSGATIQGANVVIAWIGGGVLQSTDSLAPTSWKDVTPAPAGTSLTVPISAAGTRFYRLRQ